MPLRNSILNIELENMNWGKGITVTFIIFAGLVTTMVVISMKQEVGLVATDYYKQEIAYQEQIDRINNYNVLEEKPSVTVDGRNSEVVLKFPKEITDTMLKGEFQLFRPSKMGVDKMYLLQLDDSGVQRVNVANFLKGRWKVKLNWSTNSKQYYHEYSIIL